MREFKVGDRVRFRHEGVYAPPVWTIQAIMPDSFNGARLWNAEASRLKCIPLRVLRDRYELVPEKVEIQVGDIVRRKSVGGFHFKDCTVTQVYPGGDLVLDNKELIHPTNVHLFEIVYPFRGAYPPVSMSEPKVSDCFGYSAGAVEGQPEKRVWRQAQINPTAVVPGVPTGYQAVRFGDVAKWELYLSNSSGGPTVAKYPLKNKLVVKPVWTPAEKIKESLSGFLHSVAPGQALYGVDWGSKKGDTASTLWIDEKHNVTDESADINAAYKRAGERLGEAAKAAWSKYWYPDSEKLELEWKNVNSGKLMWVDDRGVKPLDSIRTGRVRLASEADCEVEWMHIASRVRGWFEAGTRPDGGWEKTGTLRKLTEKPAIPTEYEFQSRYSGKKVWFAAQALPPALDWFATAKAR